MPVKTIYANIFGSYIQNLHSVPGQKPESAKASEAEKQMFEVIDDYVEEA